MPKIIKVRKTTASITMTPEAWAILSALSENSALSKSEYIENLVRRGDNSIYDLARSFLIEHYSSNKAQIDKLSLEVDKLREINSRIKDVLVRMGVSPNQIPD